MAAMQADEDPFRPLHNSTLDRHEDIYPVTAQEVGDISLDSQSVRDAIRANPPAELATEAVCCTLFCEEAICKSGAGRGETGDREGRGEGGPDFAPRERVPAPLREFI
jgi:hypothetical protein